MIKKPLFIFSLSLLLAINVFAQKDSIPSRRVILKLNPTQCFLQNLGASIQIPIITNWDIQLGLESNVGYDGELGYTSRIGICHFLSKKTYISFLLFYRHWKDYNINFYDSAPVNQISVESADEHASNTDDEVINPYSGFGSVDEGTGVPAYTIDNAIINVFGLDCVYGKQLPIFHSRHFIFEDYIGGGFRIKSIALQQFGHQYDHINYTSSKSASYFTLVPDAKLGFMIGYKF